MILLRCRCVALLMLAVFLIAGAARAVPGLTCTVAEDEVAKAAAACCGSEKEDDFHRDGARGDGGPCPVWCCVLIPEDAVPPAGARLPAPVAVDLVHASALALFGGVSVAVPHSSASPPQFHFKTALHQRLCVIRC